MFAITYAGPRGKNKSIGNTAHAGFRAKGAGRFDKYITPTMVFVTELLAQSITAAHISDKYHPRISFVYTCKH